MDVFCKLVSAKISIGRSDFLKFVNRQSARTMQSVHPHLQGLKLKWLNARLYKTLQKTYSDSIPQNKCKKNV